MVPNAHDELSLGDAGRRHAARELREEAVAAFGMGDYARAIALNDEIRRQLQGSSAESELAILAEASQERANLKLDPMVLYSGVLSTAVYLLGWVAALW